MLDLPDGERIQRRGTRGFPGPQIEAGVMPGAAYAFADHKPLREWPMIVTAMRVDGKNLGTGAYQQDILIADMPEQGLAGKVA